MPFVKGNFAIPLDELVAPTCDTQPKTTGFRPICLKAGLFPGNRGSAYVEIGETRVLAQIAGPKESSDGDYHSAAVHVSIAGYEEEKLRAQLTSSLAGVIVLTKYAKSRIDVDITVLNADGGILQAALLASSLALIHAGIEVLDIVLPCRVVVSPSGEMVVDPSSKSSIPVKGDVTVAVMPNLNQIVCTDIRGALSLKLVDEAIATAHRNCLHLFPAVKKAIIDSLK